MSAKFNVKKSKDLLDRAMNLPRQIIDSEDFPHSYSSEDEQEAVKERYNQKRLELLYTVQELMLETRGFVKTVYGNESEYFKWIHNIGFTSEHKGYVMNTFNINHNHHWQEGKKELISLLSNIISEEEIKAERELHNVTAMPILRLGIFMIVLLLSLIVIWQIPSITFVEIIATDKIIQSRAVLSICAGCLSLIILKPESWKELFAAFIAATLIFIPLLK